MGHGSHEFVCLCRPFLELADKSTVPHVSKQHAQQASKTFGFKYGA